MSVGIDQPWFGQLRRGAQVERRVAELDLPVPMWRALVETTAANAGLEVLTYLVPADARGAALDDQLVITVLVGSLPAPQAPADIDTRVRGPI